MAIEIEWLNDDFTTQDLLEELAQYGETIHDLREDAITASDMAERWNVDIKTARKRLNELTKDGILTREKAHLGPYAIGYAYYKKTPG